MGLAKGGQPYQATDTHKAPVENSTPTLAEIGVDKKLSGRERNIWVSEGEILAGKWPFYVHQILRPPIGSVGRKEQDISLCYSVP